MKPPKVIYVGAADYVVKVKNRLDTPQLLGETLNENTEILLRKSQSKSSLRDTLLHECLHAILWSSGHNYGLDTDDEERLVRILSPWILALMRDNPELVEYLMEDSWQMDTVATEPPESPAPSPAPAA